MKRIILLAMLAIAISANAQQHCKALTKSGNPCKNSGRENGYCAMHDPSRVTCLGKTVKADRCKMVPDSTGYCRLHRP